MEKSKTFSDWIPLLTKLVWPLLIVLALIIFNKQVNEIYSVVMQGMKEGRNVEIGGFLKLGEAASTTEISTFSSQEIPIESLGEGGGAVVRKGDESHLSRLQNELMENPNKVINTLTIPDNIRRFSTDMIKKYISTLGLKYVVFLQGNKFDGWIMASNMAAQLPDYDATPEYFLLRSMFVGIKQDKVLPTESAKEVLSKMQKLHLESLPVVDEDGNWLFFVNQGEILSKLMTDIVLESEDNE
jgi:CBS domain-containing protein